MHSEINGTFAPEMRSGFLYTFSVIATVLMSFASAAGQDTLSLFQYNITNYGNNTSSCTSTNNALNTKDGYMRTVLSHVKPDILTFNEVGANDVLSDRILQLNIWPTLGQKYKRVPMRFGTSQDIANACFYDSTKVRFLKHEVISAPVRVLDVVKFYVKSPLLDQGADTIYYKHVICHLKAGNTNTDTAQRRQMVQAFQNYLSTTAKENVILAGDFNVYTSNEPCFKLLINQNDPKKTFVDPVNRIGNWSTNSSYADVHTQCPTTASGGCFSGGGLDDRFDFIMPNRYMMNDSLGIRYQQGSYKTIGQDGRHYNTSLDNGTNSSAPSGVISALMGLSDHLPVAAKFIATTRLNSIPRALVAKLGWRAFYNGETIKVLDNESAEKDFSILRLSTYEGKEVKSNQRLKTGVYTLQINVPTYGIQTLKLPVTE